MAEDGEGEARCVTRRCRGGRRRRRGAARSRRARLEVEVETGVVEGAVLHLPVVAGVAAARSGSAPRAPRRAARRARAGAVAAASLEQAEQRTAGRYDWIEHEVSIRCGGFAGNGISVAGGDIGPVRAPGRRNHRRLPPGRPVRAHRAGETRARAPAPAADGRIRRTGHGRPRRLPRGHAAAGRRSVRAAVRYPAGPDPDTAGRGRRPPAHHGSTGTLPAPRGSDPAAPVRASGDLGRASRPPPAAPAASPRAARPPRAWPGSGR